MPQIDPRLKAFVARCEATAIRLGIAKSTLSTKLFDDGKRLAEIADGSSDIGIGRLARAEVKLAGLEGQRKSSRGRAAA